MAFPALGLAKIIWAIDIAMLVTCSDTGLRGRPMSTIPTQDKGVIYVLTESSSPAARDIRVNGTVFLSYQGRGDHVALKGEATVSSDQGQDLWTRCAGVLANGAEAHDVVAQMTPDMPMSGTVGACCAELSAS
jgi:hypothetical protein